jgi:hypothetical protein
MATFFFDAAFGDQRLRISSITTDDGRDIAIQSPSRGSRHYLQDRGAKLGRVACELLFVDEPTGDDFMDRFDAFRKLVAFGESQIFSHPLIGHFRARAEGGQYVAEAGARTVRYSCSFIPEDEPEPVTLAAAGASTIAGAQSVAVASQTAAEFLLLLGLEDSTPTACADAVDAWSEAEEIDQQSIATQADALAQRINNTIEEMELRSDLSRFPAYMAMVNLTASVRRASAAFTSISENVISVLVTEATPLLVICSSVYGADLAMSMLDRVAKFNKLRMPGLVPAGTNLSMPPAPQQ